MVLKQCLNSLSLKLNFNFIAVTGVKYWYTCTNTTIKLKNPVILRFINKFIEVMVFDATFNNISVILWQSVLLVEKTGVPGKDH